MSFKRALFIYILSSVLVIVLTITDVQRNGINGKTYIMIMLIVLATFGINRLKRMSK